MASNTDDIGSDEATEGMQDLCAYCVDKGKPQPATKFCFDCGPFGRYICGMCVQNHNYFTSGHIVKSLSDAVSHGRRKYVDVQTEKNYIEESKYVKELEAKKKAERLLEENIKNTEDLKNLSAMAGRKLEDNNPNIADLSDMNRPTKLAEKFSELYDNTWTDAFSSIQELDGYKDNEEKAIMALMNMLTTAYKVASDAAEKELTSLKEKIEQFHGSSDEKLVKDVMKPLMDSRKKRVKPTVELKHAYQSEVVEFEMEMLTCDEIKTYMEQCLELCWLMVIQDPPVFLQREACKKGDKFDKNTFREYTQGADIVEFAVWPALFLEKGGALLSKGVVQCKKRPMSLSLLSFKTQVATILSDKPKSQAFRQYTSSQSGKEVLTVERKKSYTGGQDGAQNSERKRLSISETFTDKF